MAEIRINSTGELKLYDSDDSNYVSFKSGGTVSSDVTWTLPTADGSNGQALTTDGSGTLSWATASSADPSSADGDTLGTASAEWSDLYLADGGIVYFGNDQDIRLTHNADKGLIIKHSATADDKPVILTLQTGETDMAADDVIGKIEFQAPDESTGTDAVLVSGAIQAVAEGDHSSSSNATRLEFMTGASEAAATKMWLTSGGKLGLGTAPDLGTLHVRTADSGGSVYSGADELVLENNGEAGITILSATNSYGNIFFGDSGSNVIGKIYYNHNDNSLNFFGNATNFLYMDSSNFVFNEDSNDINFRVESNGHVNAINIDGGDNTAQFFHSLDIAGGDDPSGFSNDDYGMIVEGDNGKTVINTNGQAFNVNRQNSDGSVIGIRQEGQGEGDISVSGSTVAYNTFCGAHWSRLTDNSKPTILRGTVIESIGTMMDWYNLDIKDKDNNVIQKKSIGLPNGKSVGDAHTIVDNGITYTGTISKEDNEQLPKCKISDTEDSKAVYGVFMRWDDADDGLDGDVNDMNVAALGAFVIRVHKDETIAIGDYLQSKGDGTAKKQADDILRSSTIAKVTSTTKTHTYADGSYCVPCVLHCG